MVLLTLSSQLNKRLAPFLLRHGLTIRASLGGGVIRDNPTLDALLLIPFCQRLLSLELHQERLVLQRKWNSKGGPSGQSAFDEWAEKLFDTIFGGDKKTAVQNNQESLSTQTVQNNPNSTNTGKATKHNGTSTTAAPLSERQEQLALLEKVLRRVLVPNEQWSDAARWIFHKRFLKWARTEYLRAAYGTDLHDVLQHTPLRLSPQLQNTSGLRRLFLSSQGTTTNGQYTTTRFPTTQQVLTGLDMQEWSRLKKVDAVWDPLLQLTTRLGGKLVDIPGTSIRLPDIPTDTDLSQLSLEQVLELAGGHVTSGGTLQLVCEHYDVYQLWTRDYIDKLAAYLWKRASSVDKETIVLDVGAGDGVLAHGLKEALEVMELAGRGGTSGQVNTSGRNSNNSRKKSSVASKKRGKNKTTRALAPTVIAIDDGSWRIPKKAPDVLRMSVDQAIQEFGTSRESDTDDSGGVEKQIIVLCSWMPSGVDWTEQFRRYNVDEYILIGEYDDGNCGDNWETWGNPVFREGATIEQIVSDDDDNNKGDTTSTTTDESHVVAPYELDGYRRDMMVPLTKHQFSRFDTSGSANSATISFRRQR